MKAQGFLAFDIGTKSLGIARYNTIGMALPLQAWHFARFEWQAFLNKITELIEAYHPESLIIGLPKNANGTDSKQTLWVQSLVKKLQTNVTTPIVLIDERFTTIEAHERLQSLGLNSKQRKAYVDSVSALIILEQYLHDKR